MDYTLHRMLFTVVLIVSGLLVRAQDLALVEQPDPTDSLRFYEMPQITVLAERTGLFMRVPGSVRFLDPRELRLLQPLTGNEVLRRVPGLHVVDEEGAGLRLNVGIRGLDPDRSRSVLILEDGIPVALNPYGEPEMYYTPVIDRMSGVEVLKGSGQLLYGPQTIGGVINFITADPPAEAAGRVRLQGGQNGFFSGLASYGTTVGHTGVQVDLLRKQANNLGPTEFQLHDLNAKLKFRTGARSSVGVKLGVYDEVSNATYVGLTQPMFDRGGEDFVRLAPDDRLEVRRYALSATHRADFSDRLQLNTTAFGYTTTRNWQRQDFARAAPRNEAEAARLTGVVWGDSEAPGGALFMRTSNAHRNRQFEVAGLESRLRYQGTLGGRRSELHAGARYLYERAFEQRFNGTKPDARSGALVEDEIRTGQALSAFVQEQLFLTPRLALTGGLRLEHYSYERNILRRSYGGVLTDTNIVADSRTMALIPGLGINYNLNAQTTLFAGVHRGFAPPRIKDAINTAGEPFDLDAELSWNTEVGTRLQPLPGLSLEATAFYMYFSNQIIPVALSAGGVGAGLVNAGETEHRGAEATLVLDLGELLGTTYGLAFDANATFVDARFVGNRRARNAEGDTVSIRGNQTPYAPRVFLSNALTLTAPFGLGLRLTSTYVGAQFGDEVNTETPTPNGLVGRLDAYHLLDGTLFYNFPQFPASFNVAVKNALDERYLASRRPQGIRLGLPRLITAGVEVRF